MNYANKTRVKIWGTSKVIFDDKNLLKSLSDTSYKAKPERAIVFKVNAWNINCPQHIKPRFPKEEIKGITTPLHKRIQELEEIIKKNNIII